MPTDANSEATKRAQQATADCAEPDVNQVLLLGRLAAEAEQRELPSGDVLTSFRLIVRRAEAERGSIDSVECSTTRAKVSRTVLRSARGDRLEVGGALRRRFWQGPSGLQSRYSVDVQTARRVRK